MLVEWDQDSAIAANPSLYQYRVYRLVVDRYAFYFYRTDVVPATSCVSGRCSYVERGDSPVSGRDSDPNLDCPYYPDASCGTTGTQAFYVTVQGPSGGESPRSSVVFWDCGMQGYARLHSPTDDHESIFLAMGNQSNAGNESICPVASEIDILATLTISEIDIPVDVSSSIATARTFTEPVTAPLLKLGQAGGDPPYEVIDLHVDHLGSTRYTTDEAGQRVAEHDFLPFGEEVQPLIVGIDESTKRFTGHERDRETGLDYMLGRYYDFGRARFVTPDPILGSGTMPQGWNRYVYVLNNPYKFVDPLGLKLKFANKADRKAFKDYKKSLKKGSEDLKNIKELKKSSITFVFRTGAVSGASEGETTFDGSNVNLTVEPSNSSEDASFKSRVAHEVQHGVQINRGEFGFRQTLEGNWEAVALDIGDEVEAYEAQLRQALPSDLTKGILRGFRDASDKAAYLKKHAYPDVPTNPEKTPAVQGVKPGAVVHTSNSFWRTPK